MRHPCAEQQSHVKLTMGVACDCRYLVNSIPLEAGKPLPTLSGLAEIFQHHNMQVAVHLCDPSSRGPFTPCDLMGAKDGPGCKSAAGKQNGPELAH